MLNWLMCRSLLIKNFERLHAIRFTIDEKATQRLIFQNRYKTVASDLYGKTEASKYFKSTDDEEELPTDDVEGGFQNRLICYL